MQTTTVGGLAFFDLKISGLSGVSPLGAFSVDIVFAPSIIAPGPIPITFDKFLGNTNLDEADTFVDMSVPGSLHLDEVSLLLTPDLLSLQGDSFGLAHVMFVGHTIGSTSINLTNVVLSDATGYVISGVSVQNGAVNVPEPSALLLLGSGLMTLFGMKRVFRYRERYNDGTRESSV